MKATTTNGASKTQAIKELRLIREAGRKATSSKEAALRLLVSTGMYTLKGDLKPQFR